VANGDVAPAVRPETLLAPTLVAVGHKFAQGLSAKDRTAQGDYGVVELHDALTHEYKFDAHLVTYVIAGVSKQPRLLKDYRHLVDRPVTVSVFFCDVDNPSKARWTDELTAQAVERYGQLDILKTAGIYHTRSGLRIVQPLARPIPVSESELYHRRWLHQLEAAGFKVDWSCTDWTRHYRLPHVRRDKRQFLSPYINLDRMVPIELEPIIVPDAIPSRPRARAARIQPVIVPWSKELPPEWRPRVDLLARAVLEVPTEWHTLFLALAGALLSRGVPYEHVPLLCRAISVATGNDTRTDAREAGARTTVERYLQGQSFTGYTRLTTSWPSVAAVLADVLAIGREAELRSQAKAEVKAAPPLDPDQAIAAFEDALRQAPRGVSLVAAESGLGTLNAIVNVAAERAAKPYATPDARGVHAPAGSRTSISMANHAKAIAMADELRANGTPTRLVYGPLAARNADGTPKCHYFDVAKALVAGGQVMQKELCEGRGRDPCEFYKTCTARLGADGPEDARAVVGSHAMVGQLDKVAGLNGMLVLVGLPEMLDTPTITLEDLAIASNTIDVFVGAYGTALRPALMALTGWVASLAPLYTTTTAVAAVEAAQDIVLPEELAFALRSVELDTGTAVDCARAAPLQDKFGDSPPLMYFEVRRARMSTPYAQRLGNASRVLRALHRAVVRPDDFALQVVVHEDERVLRITGAKPQVVAALRREGPVVVIAHGSVEPQAEVIAKVVGYQPPTWRVRVADAVPIARTLLRTSAATRRRWSPAGKLVLDASLVTAVRAIADWAHEEPSTRRLAIVTFDAVALALEAALTDPTDLTIDERWRAAEQYAPALDQVRERLGPVLRSWMAGHDGTRRELVVARYGAAAGMAAIRDVDALVTLGDPWAGRAAAEASAAFLGDPGAHEVRGEADCRALLERTHAGLQPFERERPGRAMHVGDVLPAGIGWSQGKVDVRIHAGGRPRSQTAMSIDELNVAIAKLGGERAAARALGCSANALRNYRQEKANVPNHIAARIRELFWAPEKRRR
jgi:hypothetical protein